MAAFQFDVFLSHIGNDKPLVRALKQKLTAAGLKVWLDEDELRPGINWQPELEAGVRSSKSIAMLIGPDGLGPWEDEEMQGALQLAVTPQKAPTTPAELWPEIGSAQAGSAIDCYRQLHQIRARGEVSAGEVRKILWQAVKKHRPASFRDWQLANLTRWSAPEYLEVEERFTPLKVNVRVRERAEGPAEKQQLSFPKIRTA